MLKKPVQMIDDSIVDLAETLSQLSAALESTKSDATITPRGKSLAVVGLVQEIERTKRSLALKRNRLIAAGTDAASTTDDGDKKTAVDPSSLQYAEDNLFAMVRHAPFGANIFVPTADCQSDPNRAERWLMRADRLRENAVMYDWSAAEIRSAYHAEIAAEAIENRTIGWQTYINGLTDEPRRRRWQKREDDLIRTAAVNSWTESKFKQEWLTEAEAELNDTKPTPTDPVTNQRTIPYSSTTKPTTTTTTIDGEPTAEIGRLGRRMVAEFSKIGLDAKIDYVANDIQTGQAKTVCNGCIDRDALLTKSAKTTAAAYAKLKTSSKAVDESERVLTDVVSELKIARGRLHDAESDNRRLVADQAESDKRSAAEIESLRSKTADMNRIMFADAAVINDLRSALRQEREKSAVLDGKLIDTNRLITADAAFIDELSTKLRDERQNSAVLVSHIESLRADLQRSVAARAAACWQKNRSIRLLQADMKIVEQRLAETTKQLAESTDHILKMNEQQDETTTQLAESIRTAGRYREQVDLVSQECKDFNDRFQQLAQILAVDDAKLIVGDWTADDVVTMATSVRQSLRDAEAKIANTARVLADVRILADVSDFVKADDGPADDRKQKPDAGGITADLLDFMTSTVNETTTRYGSSSADLPAESTTKSDDRPIESNATAIAKAELNGYLTAAISTIDAVNTDAETKNQAFAAIATATSDLFIRTADLSESERNCLITEDIKSKMVKLAAAAVMHTTDKSVLESASIGSDNIRITVDSASATKTDGPATAKTPSPMNAVDACAVAALAAVESTSTIMPTLDSVETEPVVVDAVPPPIVAAASTTSWFSSFLPSWS